MNRCQCVMSCIRRLDAKTKEGKWCLSSGILHAKQNLIPEEDHLPLAVALAMKTVKSTTATKATPTAPFKRPRGSAPGVLSEKIEVKI